jgi:hypothetical protein
MGDKLFELLMIFGAIFIGMLVARTLLFLAFGNKIKSEGESLAELTANCPPHAWNNETSRGMYCTKCRRTFKEVITN